MYYKKNLKEFEELPENVRQSFEKALEDNEDYTKLMQKAEKAERQGDFVIALQSYQLLEKIRLTAQENMLAKQEETVTLLQMDLSVEQLNKINVLTVAMYMACDIIESLAIDVNSELRKKDASASFEMFDPVRNIGKVAKENLSYLFKKTHMYDTDCFNDTCDDMSEILVNKAKKVYTNYIKNYAKKLEKEKKNE